MKLPDVGYTFELEEIVGEELTTSHMDGIPPILSTPGLVYLIEKTGDESLKPFMESHEASVGTFISLSHMAPTPVGDWVRVRVRVESVSGPKISFSFVAEDKRGKIAEGSHTRAIVDANKIREKLKKAL